jgi:hypothetical protein
MVDLEMVQCKEHVTLDYYVKPMELVQYHAQLMEDLEMETLEVLAIQDNCVKQMERAPEVCIINTFVMYYNQ